jgi:hypothetical protein
MSSVINAIQNTLAIVVSILLLPTIVVTALVETAFGGSFEQHMSKLLEQVFGFFGLKGEDIISTSVSDNRLMGDDYTNIITKIALIHEDTQDNIIDIMQANILKVRMRFNQYFDYGKTTYYNGLPSSNITTDVFPESAVIGVINTQYGVSCELSLKLIDTPTKDQWVAYKLKDLYNYNVTTNHMTYLTYDYVIDYSEYNYTTNNYDVHIYRQNFVTDTVTTTTTVSVIAIDNINETKRTVVDISISGTKSITGTYTSSSSTTTDVIVPKGSTTASTNTVITNPPVYMEKYSPSVVSVISYDTVKYFIAAWNIIGSSDSNYWVYKIGSGNTLLDATLATTNLDMLPIITIRNNSVNINASPTSEIYLQSKEMMNAIGIDIDSITTAVMDNPDSVNVQDAFVYFGIDVSDTSQTVAKYLFKVFDYIFSQSGAPVVNTSYSDSDTPNQFKITVSEGAYNAAMGWSFQTKNTIAGTIGAIGTYSNQISGADLIIRGQITESHYIEYRIVQLSVVSIINRAGLYAAVTKTLLSGPVVMPMSYNLVDQFSSMEQLELFSKGLRLSTYAAEITHLAYYQTEGFMLTIKIIVISIAIALTIATAPEGGSGGKVWLIFAAKMLAVFAVTYIVKEVLMQMTDNVLLKMAIGLIAVGIASSFGFVNVEGVVFSTADVVTTSVTQWTEHKMEVLNSAIEDFSVKTETAFKEIEDAMRSIMDNLDTTFVAMVARIEPVEAFIKGPSLTFYQAIQLQYDHVDVCIRLPYEQAFDYSRYYRIGVV